MKRNGTRIHTVMAEIQSRIAARTYAPGARIPSVRAMAQTMKVSVSTVLEAYERLMAEGVLSSRPGSGFYVAGPAAPLALTELGPKLDRVVDPLWISRQSLETASDALKPGCGWLPPPGCTKLACVKRFELLPVLKQRNWRSTHHRLAARPFGNSCRGGWLALAPKPLLNRSCSPNPARTPST